MVLFTACVCVATVTAHTTPDAGESTTDSSLETDAKDVPAVRFDPVKQDIEGWTVWVEPALLEDGKHAEEGELALKMLANHLQRVKILIPEVSLKKLQEVEIWIEHKHPRLG
ncbi:MAG: hypothetical protein MI741_21005, partial [Rhodospirillales bacterium]|nr:hypothetical protein [Rhodospirillales bacterium]